MLTNPPLADHIPAKRQGRLLAFGMTGAMALALNACDGSKSSGSAPMIAPPNTFTTEQASALYSTNYPPNSPYVYSATGGSGGGSYLTSHGYYRLYGYPGYYYRPAPGATVEFVEGGSSSYRAGSAAEADETVARGGFGEGGEGGEGHGGGGEGGHGGGGGE
jgi:hypothetical protein